MPELPDGNVFRFGGKTSRGAKIFASPRPNFPSEQAKMRLTVYLVVSPALKAVRYWTGEGEVSEGEGGGKRGMGVVYIRTEWE